MMAMTSANRKDSMISTWRRDPSQWTVYHRLFEFIGLYHVDLDREVPKFPKDEKIAYVPDWKLHRFIIFYSVLPLLLHEAFAYFVGWNPGPVIAFFYYRQASEFMMTRSLRAMRNLGHTYGFLDGDKHDRDGVPDMGVQKAFMGIMIGSFARPLLNVYLAYHADQTPASMNWAWLPVEVSLYGIILDFWFYWYHRLMHDVDGLWKFHRTHHLTKHPNPLLSIYADHTQEFFDIAGIPLMTYFTMRFMGMPMGFYEWFVCQQYVLFSEAAGHSGLRLHATVPNPLSWQMKMFDAELVIEDHDLHHRKGYRKSHNYGKQTRVWDRLFGTCHSRLESAKENIDWDKEAPFGLGLF